MSNASKLTFAEGEPTFGLVILNWNNAADTIECLDTLVKCEPRPNAIVVVDNGSHDDSIAVIQRWWARKAEENGMTAGWLTLLAADRNLGFAGGTNLGIRHLISRTSLSHILLLNNDTIVPRVFFAELSIALRGAPSTGIMGPTILEYPATTKVWYAGGREHFFRGLVQHQLTVPSDHKPVKTDFVTGCAMVVSREVLESVGDLSEHYFPAYFEDGDLCHRAMRAGYPVMYAPRPVVYHKVGSTVRAAGLSLELEYAKSRLRVVYVRRNYRGVNKVVALAYLAVTKPLRSIVEILKGNPRYGWQLLRGTASGFLARHIA